MNRILLDEPINLLARRATARAGSPADVPADVPAAAVLALQLAARPSDAVRPGDSIPSS